MKNSTKDQKLNLFNNVEKKVSRAKKHAQKNKGTKFLGTATVIVEYRGSESLSKRDRLRYGHMI